MVDEWSARSTVRIARPSGPRGNATAHLARGGRTRRARPTHGDAVLLRGPGRPRQALPGIVSRRAYAKCSTNSPTGLSCRESEVGTGQYPRNPCLTRRDWLGFERMSADKWRIIEPPRPLSG